MWEEFAAYVKEEHHDLWVRYLLDCGEAGMELMRAVDERIKEEAARPVVTITPTTGSGWWGGSTSVQPDPNMRLVQ
jgi:hypothetical protein